MSATATHDVAFNVLIRDTRHMAARAASDLADWLAYLKVDGKADRTLYSYQRQLAALLRNVPEKTVQEIGADDINLTLAAIPERSRYISRSIFNTFFDWAVLTDRLERNPMVGKVPKMRVPKRRPKDIFSEAEVELLAENPLLCLMFYTGLRRGECIGLRRSSVSLARARLVVYRGKGDKDRIIPMPLQAMQAVNELDLLHSLEGDDYVWSIIRAPANQTSWWRRKPIGDTTFENWFKRALAAAGVRYLNPHQTRHTYGQMLREKNYDIEERQVLMGHESIRTTQFYYGRLTVEDVAQKIAEVGL